MILIRKVKEPFGWMGNMASFAVTDLGREWRTTEALFQAKRFDDEEIRLAIWREKSPMGAKIVAKKHAPLMVIQPRSQADIFNMEQVLKLKLKTHPELIQLLLDTGEEQIIEDCSNRRNDSGLFWGACDIGGGEWIGKNVLGKLWELCRSEAIMYQ